MNHLKTLEQLFENTRWTEEKLQDEANQYKTRAEFRKNSNSAYLTSSRRGLLDELFKNHPNQGNINKKWTTKQLREEADKFETREDFRIKNSPAYHASKRRNLMDDIFKNHTNNGYSFKKWEDNNYVIYVYELEEYNMAYVGLTNNMERRDKDHLFGEKEALGKFCKKNNISYPTHKILEKDIDSKTAREKENYWVNHYTELGWDMFNIAKPGGLGGHVIRWTKKRLQKEVDKYTTRREFQQKQKPAYIAVAKRKLMDELFKNHTNQGYSTKQKREGYWNKKTIQEESDKYETRNEFQQNSRGAYKAALKRGLLDELFKNNINQGYSTKKGKVYWTKEKLQKVSDKYKTRNEFRKNNKGAYISSLRQGLLDELFKKHTNQGYTHIKKSHKKTSQN